MHACIQVHKKYEHKHFVKVIGDRGKTVSTAIVFCGLSGLFGLPCSNGYGSRVVDVTQFPEDTGSEREKKPIVPRRRASNGNLLGVSSFWDDRLVTPGGNSDTGQWKIELVHDKPSIPLFFSKLPYEISRRMPLLNVEENNFF